MTSPLPPILLDVESRSRADLKAIGGRLYWEHASTEAICVSWSDPHIGPAIHTWTPGDDAPPWVSTTRLLAAHNAMGFDRFAVARLFGAQCYPAGRWVDTSELARRAGLPGALDALGVRLGFPKDKAASKFTKGLSSVKRPPKKHPACIDPAEWRGLSAAQKRARGLLPEITPEVVRRVVAYCESDVRILVEAWPMLSEWLDFDVDVSAADRAVNDRGIGFDRELARRLLEEDARNSVRVLESVAAELGEGWTPEGVREVASSPALFCEYTGADNAQANTVEDLEREGVPLARARLALASIARGKLRAGLARVSTDGRIRDSHRYIGAHTWRWSGKGMQLQNMPRPADRFEEITGEELDALAASVNDGAPASPEEVDLLLRATLVAAPGHTFVDVDFAGVEARVLAYLAGDRVTLDAIAEGRDVYKVEACGIYGVGYDDVTKPQRQAGKVGVLACGYGGGAGAIERFASKMRIDLAAAGTSGEAIVESWRSTHAPVVRMWRAVEDALRECVRYGGDVPIDGVDGHEFRASGDGSGDVALFLPSGRPIVYLNVREAKGDWRRADLVYDSDKGPKKLYGGLLVENLVQADCRDLMAHALVQCEREGLPVVLHVHDQLVAEVPEDDGPDALAAMLAIFRDVPPWASGWPIDADGHVGRRHRK